jgi:Spy/CpxP family protein refolding chaperone
MSKLTLVALALALAVTVVGLAAMHAAYPRPKHGRNAESPISHRPHKSAKRHRLSQQQILSLGCGPLTEQAAEAVLRARRHGTCG